MSFFEAPDAIFDLIAIRKQHLADLAMASEWRMVMMYTYIHPDPDIQLSPNYVYRHAQHADRQHVPD